MWSKEKTIEWKELGSKGKYKKRLINKKNSCFEKNTNTYIGGMIIIFGVSLILFGKSKITKN